MLSRTSSRQKRRGEAWTTAPPRKKQKRGPNLSSKRTSFYEASTITLSSLQNGLHEQVAKAEEAIKTSANSEPPWEPTRLPVSPT